MKKPSWFAFFLILTVSCLDEPDCFQLHNNIIGITFRVIGTGQVDSVLLKDGAGRLVTVTSFRDSLNYFAREGTFFFDGVEEDHHLSFAYNVRNQFISEDCGSSFVLSDLRILEHDYDSARVVNPTPTKAGGPNIDIYRCPETDTLTIDFNQLVATTNGVTVSNPQSNYISYDFDSVLNPDNSVFSGRAATVKLPVDLSKNSAVFVFNTAVSKETLEVTYDRVTEQRYRPCGVQTFVTNLTIGKHTFDSISYGLDNLFEPIRSLLDPHVANLRVFNCPPTNLLRVDFVSAPNVAQAVEIKTITGDHFEGNLLDSLISASTVVLPVDLGSDVSTFYIQYQDDTIDTLSVQYARASLRYFHACQDPIITGLREATDASNISIVTNGTTLQFPAVKNVEITVN